MKKNLFVAVALLSVLFCSLRVQASPLALNYNVSSIGGGLYDYNFTLSVDNHDGSFASGQGWSWLTFGDAFNAPSNLTDFVFDSSDFPVGPFAHSDYSGGGHNGPTMLMGDSGIAFWLPSSIGSSLQWSGTSTAYLGQGDLKFSTLMTSGGAAYADFEVGHLESASASVPDETAVLSLWTLGLLALVGVRKLVRGSA